MADLQTSFITYLCALTVLERDKTIVDPQIKGLVKIVQERKDFLDTPENRAKLFDFLAQMFMVFLPVLQTKENQDLTREFINEHLNKTEEKERPTPKSSR